MIEAEVSTIIVRTRLEFGEALRQLRHGHKLMRHVWGDGNPGRFEKHTWIALQWPDGRHSAITQPYIYMQYPVGDRDYRRGERAPKLVPWQPSQDDLLADDWQVI